MSDLQEDWEKLSLEGAKSYAANSYPDAQAAWRGAADIAEGFPLQDPRRAAAFSNLALAEFLEGDTATARQRWTICSDLWQEARQRVAGLSLKARARSSHFHFRLEQRHGPDFQDALRGRLDRILSGAVAVSRFNLALAALHSGEGSDADVKEARDAVEARRSAWGARSPELADMLRSLAALADEIDLPSPSDELLREAQVITEAPARSALEIWAGESLETEGEERNYLAASRLTGHLMVHALLRA
jgi:hypothetical protein